MIIETIEYTEAIFLSASRSLVFVETGVDCFGGAPMDVYRIAELVGGVWQWATMGPTDGEHVPIDAFLQAQTDLGKHVRVSA